MRRITAATRAAFLMAAVFLLATLLNPTSASGQSQWLDRAEVVEKLGAEYGEQPTGMGLASNGGVIELFTAPDGATWTLVLTMPNGSSRLVAAGEGWTALPVRIAIHD